MNITHTLQYFPTLGKYLGRGGVQDGGGSVPARPEGGWLRGEAGVQEPGQGARGRGRKEDQEEEGDMVQSPLE